MYTTWVFIFILEIQLGNKCGKNGQDPHLPIGLVMQECISIWILSIKGND